MPVRNAAKTLERTIESIFNQSYTNIIEIILAIGPSDDETRSVAGENGKLDSRIKLIENKSGGTARGIARSGTAAKERDEAQGSEVGGTVREGGCRLRLEP